MRCWMCVVRLVLRCVCVVDCCVCVGGLCDVCVAFCSHYLQLSCGCCWRFLLLRLCVVRVVALAVGLVGFVVGVVVAFAFALLLYLLLLCVCGCGVCCSGCCGGRAFNLFGCGLFRLLFSV